MSLSVLILTRNEAANVPGCLASVSWSDDILVFDSFSTDGTPEISRAHGARVLQHAFVSYGDQREAARISAGFKHEWVLVVDADERVDEELAAEVRRIAAEGSPHDAFRMRRKDHFEGKWIRHSSLYPSWFVRLLRHTRVHYDQREVHEYPVVDGSVGELQGHLLHDSFSKGLEAWWSKHRAYAEAEARAELHALKNERADPAGVLQWRDPVRRRRALKGLSYRLPARPWLRFIFMFLWRGGILDGLPGYRYCRMLALYERMIVGSMRQLISTRGNP